MTQTTYPNPSKLESHFIPSDLPGDRQHPDKMQGHWVLAHIGKKVLRPGGVELTRQMLSALAIGPEDRVVEFAPGLGATAKRVMQKRPQTYWAIERDPAAARRLSRQLPGTSAQIVQGRAEESGLPDACASVVYSEALLTMQTPQQKNRIVSEAARLLAVGGRYGMHELCFLPDDIPDHLRQEMQAAMSKEIHVGVQMLCRHEWMNLFSQNGLKVIWTGNTPMQLLEPRRLVRDEGLIRSLCIGFRMASNPALGRRVLAMRRLFHKYGEHLGAISLVCKRV